MKREKQSYRYAMSLVQIICPTVQVNAGNFGLSEWSRYPMSIGKVLHSLTYVASSGKLITWHLKLCSVTNVFKSGVSLRKWGLMRASLEKQDRDKFIPAVILISHKTLSYAVSRRKTEIFSSAEGWKESHKLSLQNNKRGQGWSQP